MAEEIDCAHKGGEMKRRMLAFGKTRATLKEFCLALAATWIRFMCGGHHEALLVSFRPA